MAELFRSAFNYISQTGKSGNDFVGQYVELGPVQLRVRKVVAEGKTVIVFIRQFFYLTPPAKKFSREKLLRTRKPKNMPEFACTVTCANNKF